MDVLIRIKRLVISRRIQFTLKAEAERLRDGLSVEDVLESILNANAVQKILRSTSMGRAYRGEHLYIIESPTYTGNWVYTKGCLRGRGRQEVFYVFVSAKLAE
jgi:hypothetical protein